MAKATTVAMGVRCCYRLIRSLNGSTIVISKTSDGYYSNGGGIYASAGTRLSVTNSNIIGNQIEYDGFGGGIGAGVDVDISIRGSRIAENSVGYRGRGGAIATKANNTLVIEGTTISGNSAVDYGQGDGISAYSSSSYIRRTSILNNSSNSCGRISSISGNLTVIDSTIANNFVTYAYEFGYSGGGISDFGVTLCNSIVTGNSAERDSGLSLFGNSNILNDIVVGNKANSLPFGPDIFGVITLSKWA